MIFKFISFKMTEIGDHFLMFLLLKLPKKTLANYKIVFSCFLFKKTVCSFRLDSLISRFNIYSQQRKEIPFQIRPLILHIFLR